MREIIDAIRANIGKATFASFTYKTKEKFNKQNILVDGGEIARYTIILGFNYITLLEKSILELTVKPIKEFHAELNKTNVFDLEDVKWGHNEVLSSLTKSLEAHKQGKQNEDYTKKDLYIPLGNGLNLSKNDLTLQCFGLIQSKVVIKPGVHKVVNSAAETIIKNLIRNQLSISRFREFALDIGNIKTVKINGGILELD